MVLMLGALTVLRPARTHELRFVHQRTQHERMKSDG